jgi:hypothetical protein
MSDPGDDLVLQALKMNWDHARHIETQRMGALAIYMVMALGIGYGAIFAGAPAVRCLASELGLVTTLLFWGMTRKLNRAFRNQLIHAARGAQHLGDRVLRKDESLFDFLAFPTKPARGLLEQVRVGLMFHFIYAVFALNWVMLLGYSVLRLIVAEVSL